MDIIFNTRDIAIITKVYNGDIDYDELDDKLQNKLFQHFEKNMPYGIAKARDGDPDQWICNHLDELIS